MRRLTIMLGCVLAVVAAPPAGAVEYRDGSVYASVGPREIVLGNDLVERRWSRKPFATTTLLDKRDGGWRLAGRRRDFTLTLGGADLGSERFDAEAARVEALPGGGLRLEIDAAFPPSLPHTLVVTRTVEAYPGIAGFMVRDTLRSSLPLVLGGATLDEVSVGAAEPTAHAFRAGADWREPDWPGPPLSFGDAHPGTWRDTRTAGSGQPLEAPAQWLSLRKGSRSLFMVAERADLPSTRAEYDGTVARMAVRYPRDGVLLGPFEEQGHIEGLSSTFGRQRVLEPSKPVALEAAFTGFGSGEGDEVWQHHRYLERRMPAYPRAVTFNSNGTDDNLISTGAKDDMNFATVEQVAPIARRLGIETFILDDGWQAISGDWNPDSPEHPEPRGTPPRFPDSEFHAVRDAIAPMRLGLWMSPMSFNPRSQTFADHPEWACLPLGHGTAIVNALDPDSGSNEAGIGLWSPAAIPHVESRIRRAIEEWGVEYFKFDFLVWLDCAGAGDIYTYKDAFVAMVDRLIRDHPDVTFQIDETNDYRLFPFESVARGPSWFQNGSPPLERLLHNIWNLSPWVPSFSLGQHFLGGKAWEDQPVDTLMAAALLSHLTFFSDLRQVPDAVVDEAAAWTRFYGDNRALLDGVVHPLLDDPLAKGWTALQSWDPDRAEGALLAFRQDSPDATRRIALRNVPPGRTFQLVRAPDGASLGTVTSAQLSAGIDVTVPDARGASVVLVRPDGA